MKYDIFISYSRRDYVDAQGNVLPNSPVKVILDLLSKNEISYWFDKEGIHSSSEFPKLIVNAIKDSRMMLFVSSLYSNESENTAREIKEAIDKQKPILIMRIDNTEYSENSRYYLNTLDFIEYDKSDALHRLLNDIRKVQIEEEHKEQERAKIAVETKNQIQGFVNRIEELHGQKIGFLKQIYLLLNKLSIGKKVCPVCGITNKLDAEYCDTCGWYFHALTCININGEELSSDTNKTQLYLARNRWNAKQVVAKLTLSQMLLSNKPKLITGIVVGLILFFGCCYLFNYSEREKIKLLSTSLQKQIEMSQHLTDTMQVLIRDNFAQKEMIEQKDSFIQTYLKEVTFDLPFQVGKTTITLDSENEIKLRETISEVKSYDGTLVAVEIEKATSPEGNPIRNYELANARGKSFAKLIQPYLGDVEINVVSKVHTWFDVADILRLQGHTKEADAIYALKGKSNVAINIEILKDKALYEVAKSVFPQLCYTKCKFKMVHSSYTNL